VKELNSDAECTTTRSCRDVRRRRDRGTETRSLRPPSAVLRWRRPRHATHVVELLLPLPLTRVLLAMLRLYARVVRVFVLVLLFWDTPFRVILLACCDSYYCCCYVTFAVLL